MRHYGRGRCSSCCTTSTADSTITSTGTGGIPPDDHSEEYTFDQYGVPVPALLISPWVAAGPYKTELDPTSLLKYLMDKWRLAPLGARTVHAKSFGDVLLPSMRPDTPDSIVEPEIPAVAGGSGAPRPPAGLNDLQRALLAMTEVLEAQTHQDAAVIAARRVRAMDGAKASAAVALDRVERFLQQRRAQAGECAGHRAWRHAPRGPDVPRSDCGGGLKP